MKTEERYSKQLFGGHIYHATSESPTKGIVLGILSWIPWKPWDVQLDKNGRYIILRGGLNHLPITLIGIYAPNDQQVVFGRELLNRVDIDTSHVTILGDFNGVRVAEMDRSRCTKSLIIPRTFCLFF